MTQATSASRRPMPGWRDPVIEAYKTGLDRSLLRANLRRSPTERLENLAALQAFAEEIRRAGRAFRESA